MSLNILETCKKECFSLKSFLVKSACSSLQFSILFMIYLHFCGGHGKIPCVWEVKYESYGSDTAALEIEVDFVEN